MNRASVILFVALLPLWCGAGAATAATAASGNREVYLDTLAAEWAARQDWGNLGVNTAAHAAGQEAMRLRIGDRRYDRGVGHHANGEILLSLSGRYTVFKAEVGVQWQGGGKGSVEFEVWADGRKLFSSGRMTDSDAARPVEVSLVNARELRLAVSDAGDGIAYDTANWAEALLILDHRIPETGHARYWPDDVPPKMEGSFALIGADSGSQIGVCRPLGWCTFVAAAGAQPHIALPVKGVEVPYTVTAEIFHVGGDAAEALLELGSDVSRRVSLENGGAVLQVSGKDGPTERLVRFSVRALGNATAVRLVRLSVEAEGQRTDLNFMPVPAAGPGLPTPESVAAHPLMEQEIIEWDWRLQDGIGAGGTRSTFRAAAEKTRKAVEGLAQRLHEEGQMSPGLEERWQTLRTRFDTMPPGAGTTPERGRDQDSPRAHGEIGTLDDDAPEWELLWREARGLRRALMLARHLPDAVPLVFVTQAPPVFSHQLTQYYGRYARPGGGVYVLERPGYAMQTRRLSAGMPQGSFMHPEVTHDARRILVAFCRVDTYPEDTFQGARGHYYHLYELAADGSGHRQLTDGPFDDFSPKELPNGQVVFISTRRGGWHRCGTPGCEVYTLALMNPDGTGERIISFHETHEWDPAVLNDGRIVYTRWDYVDRNAVHYQHLWTVRPDGTAPAALYGNNTLNPVGIWEARAVPGSSRIMATAAAHHAMTAGSIVLVDPAVGVDGLEPLTRLTPEIPFPESEAVLLPNWRGGVLADPPARTPEMDRWPGQCYRSPWPLSEESFLAAYSFDPLIGEPRGNPANMFGLYLVDARGNKELLYRDLNISSMWPVPLAPRVPAPVIPSQLPENAPNEGTYYLQNVYIADPPLPENAVIARLRIMQVLPKSTPGMNNPTLGAPNAAPGKQVLGTVPVEQDGSAYFRAPSGIALAFQALDESGRAVQIMRSISYLHPGENAACIGCHEPPLATPAASSPAASLALRRPPSAIVPGPDGSRPLSYPLLVQPVLDRHCIGCHGDTATDGPPIRLTGTPEGRYTVSYNALVERVSYAAWGRGPFPEGNSEPVTQPGFFGAMGSPLMKQLLEGHQDVELEKEDWERLITWMDANALFYGTFNPADQERQLRGERIAGPDLE